MLARGGRGGGQKWNRNGQPANGGKPVLRDYAKRLVQWALSRARDKAHARRKFHDAKASDPVRAHQALLKIGELYAVEREAKDSGMDNEALLALRREKARPLLDELETWLIDTKQAVLPKSPIGQAIDYALSNWTALNRYADHGFLAIDNNAAERAQHRHLYFTGRLRSS